MLRRVSCLALCAVAPMIGYGRAIIAQTPPTPPTSVAPFDSTKPLPQNRPISRDREVALALAAAPSSVTGQATLWVLGASGYEVMREGSSGWGCFVQRDYQGTGQYPRCDDPSRVATLYPVYFLLEKMRSRGNSAREYELAVGEGYRVGKYRQPPAGSLAYMYADHDRPRLPPHVMIARPHCDYSLFGLQQATQLQDSTLGMTLLGSGLPNCELIIFTPSETARKIAGSL